MYSRQYQPLKYYSPGLLPRFFGLHFLFNLANKMGLVKIFCKALSSLLRLGRRRSAARGDDALAIPVRTNTS